jgi:hypothetical protein
MAQYLFDLDKAKRKKKKNFQITLVYLLNYSVDMEIKKSSEFSIETLKSTAYLYGFLLRYHFYPVLASGQRDSAVKFL